MSKEDQTKFNGTVPLLNTDTAASAAPLKKARNKKQVIHHVFFWLKNPGSKEDLDKLLAGLKTLKKIETIRKMHIGVPASTEIRPVVDNTFSASELMFFDDLEGQKIYQDHPIHQKFIQDCSDLWDKVIVYDAVDA